MALPKLHHDTPGHAFNYADVWIAHSARGRTKGNAIARLRPVPPNKMAYPHLSHLAKAVIHQAYVDATPEIDRGGYHKSDLCQSRRIAQCSALIWLCSSDPDLLYWLGLAELPLSHLHHYFRPLLMKFVERYPLVAQKFVLPNGVRVRAESECA